ncbi:hypothetical protein CYPRO_1279 [Cyclonatronum proteinivorum]|uniref:Uncharacterized protein n=1 Tax=Cyclonatronum proteinivorum TaxID=1457365 RepID=A0A345UJ84_9BACT|nr:hypothetical protein CYPRO_1279 [Cyclonatronum proteinivorum]
MFIENNILPHYIDPERVEPSQASFNIMSLSENQITTYFRSIAGATPFGVGLCRGLGSFL